MLVRLIKAPWPCLIIWGHITWALRNIGCEEVSRCLAPQSPTVAVFNHAYLDIDVENFVVLAEGLFVHRLRDVK